MFKENRHIRLKNHDYSSNGLYFVTIGTQKKENYFGDVVNNLIEYNELGKIAVKLWMEIPKHFKSVKLHEFIIMPNHIHGIIEIARNDLAGGAVEKGSLFLLNSCFILVKFAVNCYITA